MPQGRFSKLMRAISTTIRAVLCLGSPGERDGTGAGKQTPSHSCPSTNVYVQATVYIPLEPRTPIRPRNTDYIALDNLDDPSVPVQSPPLTPSTANGDAPSQMFLLPQQDVGLRLIEVGDTHRRTSMMFAAERENITLEIAPDDFILYGQAAVWGGATPGSAPEDTLPDVPVTPQAAGGWST